MDYWMKVISVTNQEPDIRQSDDTGAIFFLSA